MASKVLNLFFLLFFLGQAHAQLNSHNPNAYLEIIHTCYGTWSEKDWNPSFTDKCINDENNKPNPPALFRKLFQFCSYLNKNQCMVGGLNYLGYFVDRDQKMNTTAEFEAGMYAEAIRKNPTSEKWQDERYEKALKIMIEEYPQKFKALRKVKCLPRATYQSFADNRYRLNGARSREDDSFVRPQSQTCLSDSLKKDLDSVYNSEEDIYKRWQCLGDWREDRKNVTDQICQDMGFKTCDSSDRHSTTDAARIITTMGAANIAAKYDNR